jgi:hypothetical protein
MTSTTANNGNQQSDLVAALALLTQQVSAIAQRLDTIDRREPPAPPPPPGDQNNTGIVGNGNGGHWRPADIGFFYPDMPYAWGSGDLVDYEDKIFFRTAHGFANRLRVASQSRSVAKISQNLDTCFRGEAARWWNHEIDDVTR